MTRLTQKDSGAIAGKLLKQVAFGVGALLAAALLHAPAGFAATNTIGGADGSFESGLGGTSQTGTVGIVSNLGILYPTQGSAALLISNPDDEGSTVADIDSSTLLIENFTIDPAYETLRLDYNFLTNELGPSFANDTFTATLIIGGDQRVLLASDTFDSFFDAPWTGSNMQTGFRTLVADVSDINDGTTLVTLELRLDDVGDGRRDSQVLVDNLRLVEPGVPEARVLNNYVTIAPGEAFVFDGTPSSDDVGIISYTWDFAYDGWGASGSLVNMDQYTEQGVFQGTLTVEDGDGNTDTTAFTVVVGDPNTAPSLTSGPITTASAGVPYAYQAAADDAEAVFGDTLRYELTTAPAGMSVDPDTGLVTWLPAGDASGSFDVTLVVYDSFDASDSQSWSILMVPEVYVSAIVDDGRIYTARSLGNGSFDQFTFLDDISNSGTARGIVMADFDGDTDYDVISSYPNNPFSELYLYQRESGGFGTPVYLGQVGSSSAGMGSTTEDMAAEDFNNDGLMDAVIQGDSAYTWLLENTGPLVTEPENFFASDFETGNEGWGGQQCSTSFARDDTTASSGDWSLRVFATNSSCLSIDINPSNWFLSRGSTVRFDYRVPPGVPAGLLFNVSGRGWIWLGGAPAGDPGSFPVSPDAVTLVDDDAWHSVEINIYEAIRAVWADASFVSEFEWWTDSNAASGDQFWFDDFRISRPRAVSGFAARVLPATGGNGRGVDAADADNDGNMDFVRARTSSGYLYLYSGDGDGNFTPSSSQVADPGGDPYGVLLADFDSDGIPDIIANNGSSGDAYFFKGDGAGNFGSPTLAFDTNYYSSLGAFDFNGDGNMDVVATNYTNRQWFFVEGNGDGTFQLPVQFATFPSGAYALAVAAPAGHALGQPFALATQSAAEVNVGESVDFDASDSFDDSGIVSYEWDFGDGGTASGPTVSYAFSGEGSFSVVVTVTDDEGFMDRAGLKVTAFGTPPVADAGAAQTLDEADALLGNFYTTLDGTGSTDDSSIVSYEWDLDAGDGIGVDATGPNPEVSFPGIGDYTVTLTVTDTVGLSHSATTLVSATGNDLPVADLAGPTTLGEDRASFSRWTDFYDASATTDAQSLASLTMDWGDGNSTSLSPMADDFNDGNYNGWSVNGGTWSVINGELAQTAAGNAWRWLQDRNRSYRDFQLEVDFQGLGTDGYMGIVFHNSNGAGSVDTYLLYSYESWDFWRFYDWSTGTTLSDDDGVGADDGNAPGWDPNTWYHLRLVVQGNTMQLYVTPEGGTEVLANEYTDAGNAHPFGGIGLLSNGISVRYDNVKVSPLDGDWQQGVLTLDKLGHTFASEQDYDVTLTATDHAGQTHSETLTVTTTHGALPEAVLADPGVLDEIDTTYGRWNLVVDASGSSDDVRIERYTVDFGDGTSYSAGDDNGTGTQYFAVGTDLYGFDVGDGEIERVIATEDNTAVDLIDLDNGDVLGSTTLNRLQAWSNVNPGDGRHFKLRATRPVVAYLTDFGGHTAFIPSLDGSPVGREFIYYHDQNSGFYVYAQEDSLVEFVDDSGNLDASFTVLAGQYYSLSLSNDIYRATSSGRISMQTVASNGYTTVPAASGDGVGRSFLFATYTTGALSVFAHAPANIEVFDLDTGASLYTASIAAGASWHQTSTGTRRLRLESDADVEVWAGDYEASTNPADLGDDISFAGGREGSEFVLHTLRDGVVIFAPSEATEVSIDGAPVATLPRDGYLHLAPDDFPGGLGVHRVNTSKPVVIQTLGRSNTFNDLGTYLGGVTLRHWYEATGTYDVTLTVTDSVGQTDTTTRSVEVVKGDPPEPRFSAPDVADETFAVGGTWSVDFDAGASTDDDRIARFDWDFGDGSTGTGETITHTYDTPGTYTTTLTVTDHAGQSTVLQKDIEITFGDGPDADTGGPYVLGEADAERGTWFVDLDATGSEDFDGIFDYLWTFPGYLVDDFEDDVVDGQWITSSSIVESGGQLRGTGPNSWGSQGFYGPADFRRDPDGTVEMRVLVRQASASTGNMMVGLFEENPASFSYTEMPYALYFNNGSLLVYELGASRGGVGSYSKTVQYEVRILVKPTAGAQYFIRQVGAPNWTLLYDSPNRSESKLRPGAAINRDTWEFDDIHIGDTAVPKAVVRRGFTAPGVYDATLRVRDNALQADTKATTVTVEDGAPPVAEPGGPYQAEVGSFINFNGTASSDDVNVAHYDWVFGDSTGGPIAAGSATADLPYVGEGPTPRHFYQAEGTYTVQLTVTDNTLKTDTKTTTVEVVTGSPPTAAMFDPTPGAANGPPSYFNAGPSSDSFGSIVEYRWDFDAEVDSDGDGNFTNDIDDVGPTPYHSYPLPALEAAGELFADTFNGSLDSAVWTTVGATQENGGLSVTGVSSWGSRYAFTAETFARGRRSLMATITTDASSSRNFMFGLKNSNTNATYNQYPHAIYFNSGTLRIYENGSQRGTVGSYTPGNTYEVRIDLKAAGADYFIRDAGATTWTPLTNYNSLSSTASPLRIGIDVLSGTHTLEEVKLDDAGPYIVTLTVEDGAGQTSTVQRAVSAADNLPPDVITVPWVAFDPLVPHETYNGKSIRLKGIVRDADADTFQWDFGDGTQSAVMNVTNPYDLSVFHTYPAAPSGTPFTATLTVTDSAGNVGSATYPVIVRPKNLTTEINVAIDEGLWYLHQQQTRSSAQGYITGYWTSNARASATASAIQAFHVNGHIETINHADDPYVETVMRGMRQLFRDLGSFNIATQTYGEPDTNGNGIAIQTGVNSSGGQPIYQGGQVMDAIASSGTPLAKTVTGSDGILRRTYFDILTDMSDAFAWGQTEQGSGGAWRYAWNSSIDNSAAQWGAIGMLASEDIFGIPVPLWVKERNNVWLNNAYGGAGFGYTTSGSTRAGTPSGLVQLIFSENDTSDTRWFTAEQWIAQNWTNQYIINQGNRPYYPYYALTKSMRLAEPEPVERFAFNNFDWFRDPDLGLARTLIDDQQSSGLFPGTEWIGGQLRSAWGVIILSRTLFVQPPVADAGRDRVWGVDIPLTFDGSGSFHLDPFRSLVQYEWDFDGDGNYDFSSDQPTAQHTYLLADYPEDELPQSILVSLRVTDNNIPPLTDTDTAEIIIAIPPHPPVAEAAGPYTCTAGLPCELDGSGSSDIDPTDFISRYEWDLDGFPFDYDSDTGEKPTPVFAEGLHNISLRVFDNGVLNDLDGDGEVDENERLSDVDFTTVTAVPNLAPVAMLDGPITIDEGDSVTLDPSGSSDPNGDPLTYEWDLDNDGEFDDAVGPSPNFLGVDDGDYTVSVRVTDTLLAAIASTVVTVNNVAPEVEAGPDQTVDEGAGVSFTGSFTDPGAQDTHTIEWDFGDGNTATGTLTPGHSYADNGSYTVTLTVTDDDAGQGSDSLTVTVNDLGPTAALVGDTVLDEGATGSYDASGSTSPLDPIVLYEWDWDYDGSFTPSGDGGVNQTHNYPNNGNYVVAVRVTDSDGSSSIATLPVTVNDLGPTAAVTGSTLLVEGDTGNFDASGSTTPGDAIVFYEWDWNFQGSFAASGDTGVTRAHVFTDNGSPIVAVRVTDSDGSTSIATLPITVNNAPPVVEAGGDQSGLPAQTFNLDPATFTDPGVDDTHTASINWGDGTTETGTVGQGQGSGSVAGSHSYAGAGNYTVTVTVTDDDGGIGSDTLQIAVGDTPNNPPRVDAGPGDTIDEGQTFNGAGSFTDPDSSSWTATVDYGDGSGVQPLALNGTNFNLSHTYLADGSYTVIVTVNDGSLSGTSSLIVQVNDLAPTAVLTGDSVIQEGATGSYDASASTTPIDTIVSYEWDWDFDGSFDSSGDTGATQSRSFPDDANPVVAVRVTDSDGSTDVATLAVSVVNAPPVVEAGADQGGIAVGAEVNLDPATFTDAGLQDTHTATVDWGDGTAESGTVNQGTGSGSVDASHNYAAAGTYTVTVTVTDDDGDSGFDTLEISVEDSGPLACDVDGNGSVDINDIRAITAARNTPATGPDDPRDVDGSGIIDVNDARQCVLRCTNARCAP